MFRFVFSKYVWLKKPPVFKCCLKTELFSLNFSCPIPMLKIRRTWQFQTGCLKTGHPVSMLKIRGTKQFLIGCLKNDFQTLTVFDHIQRMFLIQLLMIPYIKVVLYS